MAGDRGTGPGSTRLAADTLRLHRARQKPLRFAAGKLWQDGGLVFCGDHGELIRPDSITKAFKQFAVSLGLPALRLHDLRHACATLLLAHGADIMEVQVVLGHASATTTADFYGHVSKALRRRSAERLDAAFDQLFAPRDEVRDEIGGENGPNQVQNA